MGVDALDNPQFRELLNLFAEAVSGWGYGGFREQLIEQLLRNGSRDRSFDAALGVFAHEFQQRNADISLARQALEQYPAELADAIEQAMEKAPELRGRIASKLAAAGK